MKRASQIAQGRRATVTSQLLDGILAAATAAGIVDSARLDALRAGVLARSAEVQASGRVSETVLFWLWGALVDLAGGHRVGAEIAPYASASAFGLMGEAAVQAVSLADAFESVARYVRFLHQGVTVEIDVTDRFITTVYRLSGSNGVASTGAAAAGMLWANANLALLSERAFNVRLRPVSAELACAAIGDLGGVIAEIFGTDVKVGTADWRLVFDRSAVLAVSRPVASSALSYLTAYADGELSEVSAIDNIVGMVAAEVRDRLAGGPPTVAEIAKALGLSTRTLQRRLAIAGRSFGAVLDEVRRARAEVLLADGGRDFREIAHKLGFSDRSAFTRAAIRWFGAPPSRMR
jgi:AraC-like DNA-binding protein